MANHLVLRSRTFHFRLRVPADLCNTIPSKVFLKSLKTTDRKAARASATLLHSRLLEVFTLLRSGFISDAQANDRLDSILNRSLRASEPQPVTIQQTSMSCDCIQHPLHEVIEEYTHDKQAAWTTKTCLEYGGYFRLIQDIIGDVDVATITRDTIRSFRDTLCKLPANLYKRFPGKTIAEVLLMDIKQPMSLTTVNKLLTLLGSVMRHSVKEGYIKDNPVEGLKIKNSKRADEERKAYDAEDLKRIVESLPSPAIRPERYWIPLISMLSGMRLGEVCGLHVADIRQVDDIWCFDVNEDQDKRLKTVNSKRIIPIHKALIDRGLLEYVETMRAKGAVKLWPNLKRRESDGYCHALGKWFQRFNRQYVTSDPLKCFHSFRHTFADTLKQHGVQEVLISELMGHANGSITTGRYGKRYQPRVLLDALSVISYP